MDFPPRAMIQVLMRTVLLCVVVIMCAGACSARKSEDHVRPMLESILETKKAVQERLAQAKDGAHGGPCGKDGAGGDCLFLSFWDFDGTIIDGDISEGLKRNGRIVYKGLLQVAIEQGFARAYQGVDAFPRFWLEYKALEARDAAAAYGLLPRILAGSNRRDIDQMAEEYFASVLRKNYFQSSRTMFEELAANGVQNYIISAAPHVFVENAAASLDLPRDRLHGIRTRAENGVIGDELIEPITYHTGKTAKVREIIAALKSERPDRRVFILAGFGNSYHTDGDFLKFIVEQELPAGKPLSVMINGGESPQEYRGLFREIEQTRIVNE